MKKVYTCFCTDVIHEGHLNIINEAKKYGEVIVGVLSDEAMIRFNRFPTVTFQERLEMAKNIEGVSRVIVQDEIMYDKVIEEIRPDYVIHGNNWETPPYSQSETMSPHFLLNLAAKLLMFRTHLTKM